MRMNYKMYPTDYVQELKLRGLRKRAAAFMEYYDDMEHGDHNSESFYAKSWGCSRSTAHAWIKEFKKEIDLFLDFWALKNNQHYTYVKNSTEQIEQNQSSKSSSNTSPNIGVCSEPTEQIEQSQSREVFNNYHSTCAADFLKDKEFNELYFIYTQNSRFTGNKESAYEAYKKVQVNSDLLKLAIMKYLHDPDVKKPLGLKKFLDNELYLSYMPKYLRVVHEDKLYEGVYNESTYEFIANGKVVGKIEPKRLIELYEQDMLEFMRPPAKAV